MGDSKWDSRIYSVKFESWRHSRLFLQTMLKYTDFIPVYPDVDDPEIQWKISTKKEFTEVTGRIREPAPKRGEHY